MIFCKNMLTPLVLLMCVSLLTSCSQEKKKKQKKTTKSESAQEGLVTSLFENGKVRTEINYENGLKQGVAKEYYNEGTIFQEINYNKGIKEGQAKRYYENGKLYQQTDYRGGKMHGKQLKFRDNGKPASVASFSQDEPCLGLVEYTLDGAVKKKYPSIVITPIDKMLTDNKYTLRISMSDNARSAEYYLGKLEANGCFGDKVKRLWPSSSTQKGIVEVDYYLPRGAFIMESINIIAKVKTPLGNYYISQRTYNVAAENR